MAQSFNYFGLRRGSTKSATYTVKNGKQVTKDRVTEITNKQTTLQMKQRLKIPIVAQARSVLSQLVDHSFEGVPYGEKSLDKFYSVNLKKDVLTITSYIPKGAMDCGEADYIVSQGSLDFYAVKFINDVSGYELDVSGNVQPEDDDKLINHFLTKNNGDDIDQEALDHIRANLPLVKVNDQLTFLIGYHKIQYSWTDNKNTYTAYRHSFVVSRIVFNIKSEVCKRWKYKITTVTDKDDETVTVTKNFYITDGYIEIPLGNYMTMDDEEYDKSLYTPSFYIDESRAELKDQCLATCILSRLSDNKNWLRSTSRFYNRKLQNVTYDQVIDTYLKSSSSSTSYLNSGTDGVSITGGNT